MTEFTVRPARAEELVLHWPRIEPLLASTTHVSIGRYLPIDLLAMTIAGKFQAWLVREGEQIRAIALTSITQFPRRRACEIFLVAGERMALWLPLWTETIEAYGRANGCDHLAAEGREGWSRATGLKPAAIFIVKDL